MFSPSDYADMQDRALTNQRKSLLFDDIVADAERVKNEADADIKKEMMKSSLTQPKGEGAGKKPNGLADLLLPIIGAVMGGAFFGPAGIALGLGSGAMGAMARKDALYRDDQKSSLEKFKEANDVNYQNEVLKRKDRELDILATKADAGGSESELSKLLAELVKSEIGGGGQPPVQPTMDIIDLDR